MTGQASLRFACEAMGTRFECLLADDGRGVPSLTAAAEAALSEVVLLDGALSRFRPDSLLAELARRPLGDAIGVDTDTIDLFEEALAVSAASEGLFEIAVGEASDAIREGRAAAAPCSATSVAAIEVDRRRGTLVMRRRVALDLGGIAKGHAIDVALRTLREVGVKTAIVHGGTSAVGAIGAPPGRDGWLVEIALPTAIGGSGGKGRGSAALAEACAASGRFGLRPSSRGPGMALVVTLRDECLAVSAPHGRVVEGRHHIVDPRTGEPAACAAIAAVVGPSCRTCDAWTKPLLIEGRRRSGLESQFSAIVVGEGATG